MPPWQPTEEEFRDQLLLAIIEAEPNDTPFPIIDVLAAVERRPEFAGAPRRLRAATERLASDGWVRLVTDLPQTGGKLEVQLTPEGRAQDTAIRERWTVGVTFRPKDRNLQYVIELYKGGIHSGDIPAGEDETRAQQRFRNLPWADEVDYLRLVRMGGNDSVGVEVASRRR